MNNNKLEILVTAKDMASDVIGGVGKSIGNMNERAVGSSQAIAAGVAAAGAAVAAFGAVSVQAYFGAAEASAKLTTNLMNVAGSTKANVTELEELASQLQSVGVIEDDVIKAGMSQLATFNLQGSTIAKLTPKITDMVAQMKGHNATAEDMVGINNLVGKVMSGNVGALSRYGVTLNETQAAQIANGTEAERAAMIVEVLGQNYGEVNKALRNTPQGMLTALKNDLGDLQEGVGEFIITAAEPLVKAFGDWMKKVTEAGGFLEYFKGIMDRNKNTLIIVAGAIMGALVPALVAAAAGVWAFMAPLLPFIAIGAAIAILLNELAKKMGGWGVIMQAVQGIAAQAWAVIKAGVDMLMPSIMALWNTFTDQLLPALQNLWNFISPILIPILKVLAAIIGGVVIGAIWLAINVIRIIIAVIAAWINWGIQLWTTIAQVAKGIGQAFVNAWNWIRGVWNGVVGFFGGIVGGIRKAVGSVFSAIADPFNRAVEFVKGIPQRIVSSLGNIGNMIRNTLGNYDIPGPLGKVKDVIPGFARGVNNFSGGLAVVGERGPELVNLPRGADVVGNHQLAGLNAGGVRIEIYGNIVNETPEAARAFFDRLDRQAQLAEQGFAI